MKTKFNEISVKETVKKAKDFFIGIFNLKKDDRLWGADIILTSKEHVPQNSIRFMMFGEEVMRISEDGFHWKGKLVENDREIYQIVREFFIKAIGDYEKH
jgi:hypothetical protein